MAGLDASAAASSLGALIVILGVLAGATVLLRRLRGSSWGQLTPNQASIKLVATRALGGQHSLAIAEAEGQRFLIGISRTGITAIGRLDGHE